MTQKLLNNPFVSRADVLVLFFLQDFSPLGAPHVPWEKLDGVGANPILAEIDAIVERIVEGPDPLRQTVP